VSEERGVDRLHALDEAVALHQKGKLTAAEELYLSALKAAPGNFDVQHLFGLLRFQQGRMTEALSLVELALSKDASSAVAWSNHALILYALERHEASTNGFVIIVTFVAIFRDLRVLRDFVKQQRR